MRLIDADALKKALIDSHINRTLTFDIATYNCVMHAIDNAPTVEPLERIGSICDENCGYRPHGEWIFRSGVTCGGYYKCSNCGEVERAEKNYCPNCGADMREEADNEQ